MIDVQKGLVLKNMPDLVEKRNMWYFLNKKPYNRTKEKIYKD